MNELKKIFKKADEIVIDTFSSERPKAYEREIIENTTFYNGMNSLLTNDKYLKIEPLCYDDLSLKRDSLRLMFKNRAKFLFNNLFKKYDLLLGRTVSLLDILVYQDMDVIEKNIPILYELNFYFDNPELYKYSSLHSMASCIVTDLYNNLKITHDVTYEYSVTADMNKIHSTMGNLLLEIADTIKLLSCEAINVYFPAGDYVGYDNREVIPMPCESNYLDDSIENKIIESMK